MRTPYGTVKRDPYGTVTLAASREQLTRWARRPGESWPCSDLAGLRSLWAQFDSRGDLVDISHPGAEDIAGHEFDAWADDVRAFLPEEVTS